MFLEIWSYFKVPSSSEKATLQNFHLFSIFLQVIPVWVIKIYPDSQIKQQNKCTLSSKNTNYGTFFLAIPQLFTLEQAPEP